MGKGVTCRVEYVNKGIIETSAICFSRVPAVGEDVCVPMACTMRVMGVTHWGSTFVDLPNVVATLYCKPLGDLSPADGGCDAC